MSRCPELIIHDIEKEVRRVYILSVEDARSEVRLVEVEMLILLVQQRTSYSLDVRVT